MRETASGLFRDVRGGDGRAACARLIPSAARSPETAGESCHEDGFPLPLPVVAGELAYFAAIGLLHR